MMPKMSRAFAVVLTLVCAVQAALREEIQSRLQAIASQKSSKYNCSIAIALRTNSGQGGAPLRVAAASGGVDAVSGRKAHVGDAYPWGSVTKMLTGASIMRLVSEGAFSLDDEVQPLVDPFLAKMAKSDPEQSFASMADLWGAKNVSGTTIRNLLSMDSGIPDFDTAKPCMPHDPGCLPTDPLRRTLYATPNQSRTPVELMSVPWVAHQWFDCKPFRPEMSPFCYSSTNFMILGLVLAAHAGVSVDEFDQGMFLPDYLRADLRFAKTGAPSVVTPVHGYDRTSYNMPAGQHNDHDNWDVAGVFAGWTASDIVAPVASVADLAWEIYGPPHSVAPASYVKQMVPQVNQIYGLGTFNLSQMATGQQGEYGVAYGHLGATYGYQSIVAYYPKLGVALSVATNIETDNQAQPMDTLCFAYNAVAGVFLNRSIRCTFESAGYYGGGCQCDPADEVSYVMV